MNSSENGTVATMLNVLVVEDEALVALNLEDMLEDLGHKVAGSAMRIEQAMELIDHGCPADVAILDVNLAGKPVFPVAEKLAGLGMPLVFATGYGRSGLPAEWQSKPVLQKPYTMDQVAGCLRAAVAGAV